MDKKTIIFFVNSYAPKMETFIYNYIKQASESKKYNIIVLCHNYPDRKFNVDDDIEVLESKIASFKTRLLNAILFFLTYPITFFKLLQYGNVSKNLSVFCLANVLKNKKFDIIHAHFGHNATIIAPLIDIGFLKSKLLAHFYGLDMTNSKCRAPGYYKWVQKTMTYAIGSTKFSERLLIGLGFDKEKIILIPVGTNKEIFTFDTNNVEINSQNIFKIIFIGRFIELKGVLILPKIAYKLEELGISNFEIQIIGSGALQQKLEEEIKDNPKINLLGYKTPIEVKQFLYQADVLIYPGFKDKEGREENQCLTVQEAMFMKKPVVVSNIGGVPESVIEDVTGFIVEANDIDGFAQKLKVLYKNPLIGKNMGEAGYKHAINTYEIQVTNNKMFNLYDK